MCEWHEVYLSGHWFMQRTFKVDAASRQKMWQVEVKVNAQQKKADRVRISYVDRLLINNTRHIICILYLLKNGTSVRMWAESD